MKQKNVWKKKNVQQFGLKSNIIVVISNKLVHALDLRSILKLNPRSVYNNIDEFHTLVEEEEADVLSFLKVGTESTKLLSKLFI